MVTLSTSSFAIEHGKYLPGFFFIQSSNLFQLAVAFYHTHFASDRSNLRSTSPPTSSKPYTLGRDRALQHPPQALFRPASHVHANPGRTKVKLFGWIGYFGGRNILVGSAGYNGQRQ